MSSGLWLGPAQGHVSFAQDERRAGCQGSRASGHRLHSAALHHPGRSVPPGMGRWGALDRWTRHRVESPHVSANEGPSRQMRQSDRNRRFSAIAIRADGRHVPVMLSSDVEVSIIGNLASAARASRPYHRLPVGAWGQAEVAPARRNERRTTQDPRRERRGSFVVRDMPPTEGPTTEHREGHTP